MACGRHGGRLGDDAGQPGLCLAGWFGAEGGGEHREPVAHRGGFVVDDVVDRRSRVLEGEHSRGGAVVEVHPGEDPAAVTDDRVLPFPNGVDQRVVGSAVERAVAQRDAAEGGGGLFQVGHRAEALLCVSQQGVIERIGFGLDRSALPQVAVGREALRHEPTHAGLSGRGQ